MSKLNIFIDGTWLTQISKKGRDLSNNTIYSDSEFIIDYEKFNKALLNHVQNFDKNCNQYGELYFVTSIFSLDNCFDLSKSFCKKDIRKIDNILDKQNVLINYINTCNYKEEGIHKTTLTPTVFSRLIDGTFNEKQVDTHVAVLLVESAMNNPNDYHVVVTGDNDIVPAIDTATKYSKNVFIATSINHDRPNSYISSYKQICDLDISIDPFYLENNIAKFMKGDNVYECSCCSKFFGRKNPIPKNADPTCTRCYQFYQIMSELNIEQPINIYG